MAFVAACPVVSLARDLTVVARGDAMPEALHHVVATPFTEASHIPLQVETWPGGIDALRSQLKGAGGWDVVEVSPEELATACSEGLVEKLDWAAIGGKEHYLPPAISDCGVGAALSTTVLAWDREKFSATPTWADFWDVAKYPGKRGLFKGVQGNLEFALIADGVSPPDVYKVLATSEGVDRAFRKLDQLKPYIVWWQSGNEAAHILSSGDVLMTTAPSGRVITTGRATRRNFGIQWSAGLYQVDSWAVAKGSPNLRQAEQLLYFLGMPVLQGRVFESSGVSGLAKGANDSLAADLQAQSATAQPNLNAAIRIDAAFWHDNLAKLQQRFDAWLGH